MYKFLSPLIVLVPHVQDLNLTLLLASLLTVLTVLTVLRVVYAIVRLKFSLGLICV